ncbi:MAG: hypothetical protein KA114_01855 [Bacteroidales bacterium]|nr:hypothetical protein [Bacteroidales bacterium]
MSINKRLITLILALLTTSPLLLSQSDKSKFIPIAEIFTDFHFAPGNSDISKGFNLKRAWFGSDLYFDNKFHATFILNMAKLIDTMPYYGERSPIREASIGYNSEKLKIAFGITGTRVMMFQQKFCDKRYVASTFQSLNGYGGLFDLGLAVDYKFNDIIEADFTLMNGDGVSNKTDGSLKVSAGINIYPLKQLVLRIYGDTRKKNGLWQSTFIGFAGFSYSVIKIGGEINYKSNLDLKEGHNAWGVSLTGSINLAEKFQLFTRYDYSTSVIVPGDFAEWNYKKDGSLIIGGLQYTFNKSVRIAVDYQATIPADNNREISDMIFLHAHFKL